jgi:hypothetical protein
MPPLLAALWNLFGILKPFQRLRLVWQFAVVVLVFFLLTVGWWVAFYMRLSAYKHKQEKDHLRLVALNMKCQKDKDTRLLTPKQCDEARTEAAHDFHSTSWWIVWDQSYICGALSCWDTIFGSDSSVITLSTRLAIVGVIIATSILLVNAINRCVNLADRKLRGIETHKWETRLHDADRMQASDVEPDTNPPQLFLLPPQAWQGVKLLQRRGPQLIDSSSH